MASSSNSAYIPEGASTNRPPFFDGQDYYYWKGRMRLFIESQHIDLWDIIETGPFCPKTTVEGEERDKPKNLWTEDEKNKVMLNNKAKYYLTCALSRSEYDKIAGLDSAKQVWDTLQVSHEGTNQVKEAKTSILTRQYEMFKMKDLETIDSMFARFTVLINDLKSLGKTYSNQDLVRKILRSLPKKWRPKVTAITEAKDLSQLKLDELLGSLKVHEQELEEEEEEPKKAKGIALKVHQKPANTSLSSQAESEEESSEEDEEDSDEASEISFISRKLQKMWRKRKGKGRPFISKRKEFSRGDTHAAKQQVICYECKKPGHFKNECPQLKKPQRKFPKRKGMMATWEDMDEETSSDDDAEESANLCLMADEVSESEESEVNNSDSYKMSYNELEHAFDNLLYDSNFLAQKSLVLKEKFYILEKEKETFEKENGLLKEKVSFLIKKNTEKAKISVSETSNKIVQTQSLIEKENEELKVKVISLTDDLARFVNGTKNLERLLGSQQCVFDKAGLGYKKLSKQKAYKNLFVPAKIPDAKCFYCHKKGHRASSCDYRNAYEKPVKTNKKGPKKAWVPKKLNMSDAEVSYDQKEKQYVVSGQWVLKAHDRGQNQVPHPPR